MKNVTDQVHFSYGHFLYGQFLYETNFAGSGSWILLGRVYHKKELGQAYM